MKTSFLTVLLATLALVASASAKDKWQTVRLGEKGPTLLIPPGAVASHGNGDPEQLGSSIYEFSVRVDDNMAVLPFVIRVDLALHAFRPEKSDKGLDDLLDEVKLLDRDARRSLGIEGGLTWWKRSRTSLTWISKDRGEKELRKVYIHPTDPNKPTVRELWISCPDRRWIPSRVLRLCDSWIARIESSFQPYREEPNHAPQQPGAVCRILSSSPEQTEPHATPP